MSTNKSQKHIAEHFLSLLHPPPALRIGNTPPFPSTCRVHQYNPAIELGKSVSEPHRPVQNVARAHGSEGPIFKSHLATVKLSVDGVSERRVRSADRRTGSASLSSGPRLMKSALTKRKSEPQRRLRPMSSSHRGPDALQALKEHRGKRMIICPCAAGLVCQGVERS